MELRQSTHSSNSPWGSMGLLKLRQSKTSYNTNHATHRLLGGGNHTIQYNSSTRDYRLTDYGGKRPVIGWHFLIRELCRLAAGTTAPRKQLGVNTSYWRNNIPLLDFEFPLFAVGSSAADVELLSLCFAGETVADFDEVASVIFVLRSCCLACTMSLRIFTWRVDVQVMFFQYSQVQSHSMG